MELVDTHCHIQTIGNSASEPTTASLWSSNVNLTADKIIVSAQASGVTSFICIGCSLADSQAAIDFVQARSSCYASIGIHPHEAKSLADNQAKLKEFASLALKPKVIAIGECGLDFHYHYSSKADQMKLLNFQLQLAQKHNLPVILHVRDAFTDFWPLFDNYSGIRGVVHSFSDSQNNLHMAISRGLYIGVNGIATFTKSKAQLEMYKSIPHDKLVFETDAPFLTPVPYRGTVNEPKYIREIVSFVAKLKRTNVEDLAVASTQNARLLFGI